jgi:transcriptional regulator with XRE-family HTH domain
MGSKRVNPADIDIGRRIRLQRLNKSMSQSELGTVCGVTFQQVQKYEKGTNRVSGSRIKQIAVALGVAPAFFFGGDGKNRAADEAATETIALINRSGALRLLKAYDGLSGVKRDILVKLAVLLAGEVDTDGQ